MKDYDKSKEFLYLNYWDVNNLYEWEMPQRLPVGGFKWVESKSQFSKDFIENCNQDSDEGYFHEVDAQYHERLHDLHKGLLFCLKK